MDPFGIISFIVLDVQCVTVETINVQNRKWVHTNLTLILASERTIFYIHSRCRGYSYKCTCWGGVMWGGEFHLE